MSKKLRKINEIFRKVHYSYLVSGMGTPYIAATNTVDAKGWSKKGIGHQTKQHELIYIY